MVSHVLNIFDINLAQVNPNGWGTLIWFSVVVGEHGMDLMSDKIKYMYCLKRNDLDKSKGLHLKLLDSSIGWKNKYF